ncbi:hypothetical protein C7M84_000885 [Penaeus vannamei]|uniref:Uncharacterized protein n=1 Tax=Penaeus vannamei TaxID=6689 RepID=A0A423TVA6_PENVA|nr:hypothetical protein C7M84_000885 [Penaeus vannamei]
MLAAVVLSAKGEEPGYRYTLPQRDSGFSVATPQHAQGSTESRKGYSYTAPKTPFVHSLGPFPSVGTKYSRVGADDSSESRETANMSSMKPTYSRFGTESADESTELSRFSATGQISSREGTDASVASMEASYYSGPRYYEDFDSSPEKTGRSSIADESQAMSHFFAKSSYPNRGFDDSLEVSTPIMKHPHPGNSHKLGESHKRIYIPPRKTSYTYHTPRSFHPPTNSQKRPHFPFQTMRFEASKPRHSEPESRDASPRTRYSSVSLEDSREEGESNYAARTHFALSMEDSDESLDESHESEYGYDSTAHRKSRLPLLSPKEAAAYLGPTPTVLQKESQHTMLVGRQKGFVVNYAKCLKKFRSFLLGAVNMMAFGEK